MWIFSRDGFFSAVQKPEQVSTNLVTIRSRDRNDLINLMKSVKINEKILSDAGTDYEFRIIIRKRVLKKYTMKVVDEIDYSNFKHEVEIADKKKAGIYLRVWEALLGAYRKQINVLGRIDDLPLVDHFDDGGIWRECGDLMGRSK
jgi:hypothetical protein